MLAVSPFQTAAHEPKPRIKNRTIDY
jgi:hypothetical protein